MISSTTETDESEIESTGIKIPVKRVRDINWQFCVICQRKNSCKIIKCTEKSVRVFEKSLMLRQKMGEESAIILRLCGTNGNDLLFKQAVWHKSCYSSFTSKKNIIVFGNRKEAASLPEKECESGPSRKVTRHCTNFKIQKCVFCQLRKDKCKLVKVQTKDKENEIKAIARVDLTLLKKIGDLDLIAYEIKYHNSCLVRTVNKYMGCEKEPASEKQVINQKHIEKQLFEEVERGLNRGKVYSSNQLFERYKQLGGLYRKRFTMKKLTITFKDKVQIVRPLKRNQSSLIFPNIKKQNVLTVLNEISDLNENIEMKQSDLSKIHEIATQIKSEINSIQFPDNMLKLNLEDAKNIIPNNLYILIMLLISDDTKSSKENQCISICQDIIFNLKNGKILPPKNVILGLAMHQSTRSKKLINVLNDMGHCISYKDILRVRSSIANSKLRQFMEENQLYIPKGLKCGELIQFAADNVDVIEDTLDGRGTFHGTQIAAFQRNESTETDHFNVALENHKFKLLIPHSLHEIKHPPKTPKKTATPAINTEEFLHKLFSQEVNMRNAHIKNQAFVIVKDTFKEELLFPQWTGFNQKVHLNNHSKTTTCNYFPILAYVASDYDTIWTVITNCKLIASKMDNPYVILTFDQAIYYKAKELQWLNPEYCENVIIRLGGFHIMLNFIKCIGKRMQDSGILDVWLESGLYNLTTLKNVLIGKHWNRAVRCHKLTYEALWRILFEQFWKWITESLNNYYDNIVSKCKNLKENFESEGVVTVYDELCREISFMYDSLKSFLSEQDNPTFKFWLSYLDMLEILFAFLRSEREGNWDLHVESFEKMLPWFSVYDHLNYAKWGTVYLHDMKNLQKTSSNVYQEFSKGNFVVKRNCGVFNQVSVDLALEHINKDTKSSGGVIGLTTNDARRDEWCLINNDIQELLLSYFANKNNSPYKKEESRSKDHGNSRMQIDENYVCRLQQEFYKFKVFSRTEKEFILISTDEVVDKVTEMKILDAYQVGQQRIKNYVSNNMESAELFYKTVTKYNMPSLRSNKGNSNNNNIKKETSFRKGQEIIQRLLSAKERGRKIDCLEVFAHELTTFPMAIAPTGELNLPNNKSALIHIISEYTNTHEDISLNDVDCIIYDGMAILNSIGKPSNAVTFGDLADAFSNVIFNISSKRIDLVFDNYNSHASIKNSTHRKRSGNVMGIKRSLDDRNTPLPKQWDSYIHSRDNKALLTNFLATELLKQSRNKQNLFVTAGGFLNVRQCMSNYKFDVRGLETTQEEADTRLLLHANHASKGGSKKCLIISKDTDVLVLLAHFKNCLPQETFMRTGNRTTGYKYIAIHELTLPDNLVNNLPAFHALTGCDSTSQFVGFGKKSCFKMYQKHSELLNHLGRLEFSAATLSEVEQFILKLYTTNEKVSSLNQLRSILAANKPLTKLPPTLDALKFHALRAHFQSVLWYSCLDNNAEIPDCTNYGWKLVADHYEPIFTSLPSLPKQQMYTTCNCKLVPDSLGQDEMYFSKTPKDVDVVDGKSITLPCEVTPNNGISYYWELNGSKIDDTTRRYQQGSDLHFTRVDKERDSGKFTCIAQDLTGLSITSSEASLNIHWIGEASVQLQSPESASYITSGSEVILRCHLDATMDVHVEWFRNADRLTKTSRIEIKKKRLHIKSVNPSDNGIYRCIARNEAGIQHSVKNFALAVAGDQTALIQVVPNNQLVKKGGTAFFDCVYDKADGLEWYFKDVGPLESNTRITLFPNGSLQLHNVQESDQGMFNCVGIKGDSTEVPQSYTAELKIAFIHNLTAKSFEPLLPEDDPILVLPQGSLFQLTCLEPHSQPLAKKYWLNQLGHTISDSGDVKVDDDGRLIIQSLQPQHAGNYTCVAENIAGKTEKSVKLVITIKPSITVDPLSITVDENQKSVLTCVHESNKESEPYTLIKWRKDGKLIKHDYEDGSSAHQRVRIYKHNGTLLIHSTKASDRGEYICEITTTGFEPVLSKPATISVIEALKFAPPPVNKKLELGSTAKIHCKAQGTPPPLIRWEKHGIEEGFPGHITDMNGTLHFNGVLTEDKGKYTCFASNSQGIINVTLNIDVVVAPKFTVLAQNPTEAIEGFSVMLNCVAEGDPKPTIHWDKNLKMNDFNRSRFEVLQNGTLYIKEVLREDENNYGCTAGSSAGLNRKEIRLIVHTREGYHPGENESEDSAVTKAVLITMSVAAAYIILVIGLMIWCRYRRRSRKLPITEGVKAENGDVDHTELKEEPNGTAPGSSQPDKDTLKNSHKEGQKSDGAETAHSHSSNQSKKSKSSYDKISLSRNHLTDIKLVGRGEFGEIMIAKLPKSAVPSSDKRASSASTPTGAVEDKELTVMVKSLTQIKDEAALTEFKREIDIFSKSSHENVIKLWGLCRDVEPHYMILEYTDWGDLKQFLIATKKGNSPSLTAVQCVAILHHLARGMEHLAAARFVHRDLAARNCLVTSTLAAKIALPRLTKEPYSQEYCKHINQIIPLRWLPYEAVYEDEYSTKSDVYAFGVLILEIFTQGELPFPKMNDNSFLMKLKEKAVEWKSHKDTPNDLQKLQELCWDVNPQDRPSFDHLVKETEQILKSM